MTATTGMAMTGMMLAAGEEEMITMTIVFGFILAAIVVVHRSKHKQARLRLVERALQEGNLDDATRKQLLDSISASGWAGALQQQIAFLARHVVFVSGWLGIFTGLGMTAWGGIEGDQDVIGIGVVVALISFGVVTVPMALRELQGRSRV